MLRMLLVENRNGSAVVLWEPFRIERKETGSIVVGGSRSRALPLPGTNALKPFSMQMITVELTGSNYGPWRVLVPVSRYDLIARLETLFRKPVGTLVGKSRALDSVLRGSRTWVASEWFDDDEPEFAAGWDARIGGPYDLTRGRMSVSETKSPARPPPPWAGAAPTPRGPGFGPLLPRPPQVAHEDSQTFFFILRCFHARYNRWPTNLAEVKAFAAVKANRQPEVPISFEDGAFENAVFATNADGGLTISYHRGSSSGSMSIGGMPK